MLMAMARMNLPAVYLYGGTILPGTYKGSDITIQDVFEAVGAHAKGTIDDAELLAVERAACPTTGSCAGMYTANTMAAVGEAIGMSLPGSASARPRWTTGARCSRARAGSGPPQLVAEGGPRPRDIMTKEAFENAITVVMAVAGSTNAVLHLLAIAREAARRAGARRLRPDRRRTVPHLVDVRPAGRFVMSDLDRVGGVPVVMKELLDAGLLHGDCMTVTGRTIAENLAALAPPSPTARSCIRRRTRSIPRGGIAILRGNLAPDGAVMKVAGAEELEFRGRRGRSTPRQEAFDAVDVGRDRGRRRHGDPLRGAEGLARHAGDARRDRGRRRRGPGQGRGADHRRPLQRRHEGLQRRAHRAGGVRGRPDRAGARR